MKRSGYCHDGKRPMQLRQLADPAARRAALWLVLQVNWYIPSGPPRRALRLGDTPQDAFLDPAAILAEHGCRSHRVAASISQATLAWICRRY
jgi:hypothetical protein